MSERSSALLALYKSLIDRVKVEFDENNTLTVKGLYASITKSKDYLRLKNQVEEEELALVEQFLKRDIGHFLQEQHDHSLSYSPTMIAMENTLWHWLCEITDKTQVQWHELLQDFKHQGHYKSDEIVNQGTMICTQCGYEMSIEFPGTLPDCPECDGNEFIRQPLEP